MPSPFPEHSEFRRLLDDDPGADLTRIALEIAGDACPDLDPNPYLARIDELSERVRDRCAAGAKLRSLLGHINWVLFVEERFEGESEHYYDPRNSYLNEVLDRRTGIPISLSVLYMAVAARIGLEMSGVNLPAHFVIRAGRGEGTVFVDPFHGGRLLDREGCLKLVAEATGQEVTLPSSAFQACSTATIVGRMLRNLKGSYLREHDFVSVLPVLRRLVALEKGDPIERRDLGVACLQADRPGEAVEHLKAYVAARKDAPDIAAVNTLLQNAWAAVAARN